MSKCCTHRADAFIFHARYDPYSLFRFLLPQISRAPAIGGFLIRDVCICHVTLCGSSFWGHLSGSSKLACDHVKFVKLIFDGHHRGEVLPYIPLFECTVRFLFKKHESNHWPALSFFHFSKIYRHSRLHTGWEQNYDPDSAEILTVAICMIVNFSCDSGANRR